MALFISPMKNVILEYRYIYFLRTILSFNEDKAKYLIYKYKKMYIHCREYYIASPISHTCIDQRFQ